MVVNDEVREVYDFYEALRQKMIKKDFAAVHSKVLMNPRCPTGRGWRYTERSESRRKIVAAAPTNPQEAGQ
jgi:hypothetical protein